MRSIIETKNALIAGEYNDKLKYLYSCDDSAVKKYAERYIDVIESFEDTYGEADEIALFSAPGRTEIGGNHTDHQHGCVLAGSVNLDVISAARPNGTNTVRIQSRNYKMDVIDLDDLEIHPEQFDKAIALIRGVIKKFVDLGYEVKGFDAYTTSNVLKGSGLSSSAAFEVLVGTIINGLFANNEVNPIEIAKFGQFAENVYYDKPSGLMDQMASSVGSVVAIDFMSTEEPVVNKVEFDLKKHGHALCIIDSGADHAELTSEYATIPAEMKEVAAFFGKEYLREIDKSEFLANIKNIREKIDNDRAVLRAIHFLNENERAQKEVEALRNDDFEGFKRLVKESGFSSYMYLQNVFAASMPKNQAVSLTLALCDEILGDKGAYRVHGGGFAGTVQAFVPFDMLDEFKSRIEAVLGENMCHVLSIRPVGGYELK
ncbi:MAG: galactokinase [Oscillospiraceae bacterium]|nr:galactokinase [Oscillospiraceae bacterium]